MKDWQKLVLKLLAAFFCVWLLIRAIGKIGVNEGYFKPKTGDKYDLIAYYIHKAFAGPFFGYSEKALFAEVEGLSKRDLEIVFDRFGYRSRKLGGRFIGLGKPINLIHWFDKELKKRDYRRMYIIWRDTGLFEKFSERLKHLN